MNIEYILIVHGEPYSTFSEILGKFFKKKKRFKKKIILIGSYELINSQIQKLGHSFPIYKISNINEAKKNRINLINIKFKYKKIFDKISIKSNKYIKNSFNVCLENLKIIKNNGVLINGPLSKKTFFLKKDLGVTEYLSKKTGSKNEVMLIYSNKLSVSPLTTHIPIKYVAKRIEKQKIIKNIISIKNFYKTQIKKNVRFAVLGLNPHCETIDKFSEEEKIIKPSIKILRKKGLKIDGPFSADTFFLKKNIIKYDVVCGMYHDQVLTPIKTLYNFEAINVTLGLPFIRISPDHGPNNEMLGKNKSDQSSFAFAMNFIDKYK